MNEFEFADRFPREYKIKGAEIIPALCLRCGGGGHRDKETFAFYTENRISTSAAGS